jgi:hypothetical protein
LPSALVALAFSASARLRWNVRRVFAQATRIAVDRGRCLVITVGADGGGAGRRWSEAAVL